MKHKLRKNFKIIFLLFVIIFITSLGVLIIQGEYNAWAYIIVYLGGWWSCFSFNYINDNFKG